MGPSTCPLWLVAGSFGVEEIWLVDIAVLPVGLQTPSAPTFFVLTSPLGSPVQSHGWLQASASVLVRLWKSLLGTAIPCSCQQTLLGISNGVWVWYL